MICLAWHGDWQAPQRCHSSLPARRMMVRPGSGSLIKTFSQGPLTVIFLPPTSEIPQSGALMLRGSEDRAACAGFGDKHERGLSSVLSSTKVPPELLLSREHGFSFFLSPSEPPSTSMSFGCLHPLAKFPLWPGDSRQSGTLQVLCSASFCSL